MLFIKDSITKIRKSNDQGNKVCHVFYSNYAEKIANLL